MTKSDAKDATLATVIIGAAAMFMGTMFASAAPADIPAPVHSIVTPADIIGGEGGDMSFESEGGSLLGD